MLVDVVLLPEHLKHHDLFDRVVVVFDVLRATTSIAAALASGVCEIRVFKSIEDARSAASQVKDHILCGEINALAPEGFDLGNSPGAFVADVCRDKTMLFSTTNGTNALIAARKAPIVLIGALVNASSVANAVRHARRDVILLCSGTEGFISMEDVIGAGAVIEQLRKIAAVELASDTARIASHLYRSVAHDLPNAMRETRGGRNVINAGLEPDIDFAARLNSIDVVARATGDPPVIRRVDHVERLSV
jgi:2-phosphosulfolactate phosphatase